MGEKIVYLCKGLLFSSLITGVLMLLVALFMYKAGISESIAAPLVVASYLLAAFVGGLYFAKHAKARRFLWGLLFGAAFYVVYLLVAACYGTIPSMKIGEAVLMLAFSLVAGMAGGMLS
ncbi:MAG: TIGR04086 family membrane protein [Lachnospiraceae bacterium]